MSKPLPISTPQKKRNKPPLNKQQFTVEEVAEALRESRGFVSATARRLACDPLTVYNYMERYPELVEIRKEAKEAEKDLAEMMLGKMIREGQFPATCFFLKTQAKDRGYIERSEVEMRVDVTKLTDDQLDQIIAGRNILDVLALTPSRG